MGAPEVVAGIAQRALAVIHEAAQITRGQSQGSTGHSSRANSTSDSQGAANMGGGSSAIYSQGPKQQGNAESTSKDSQGNANTPAMPSMSGTSTATSYSDSSKHRSLTGTGRSNGSSGVTSNPTSSNQGSDNMGGGSSAIYSQGPRQGGNSQDKQVHWKFAAVKICWYASLDICCLCDSICSAL